MFEDVKRGGGVVDVSHVSRSYTHDVSVPRCDVGQDEHVHHDGDGRAVCVGDRHTVEQGHPGRCECTALAPHDNVTAEHSSLECSLRSDEQ